MDLSILTPVSDQTVRERYDSLVDAGINFRFYKGGDYAPYQVIGELQKEFRVNELSYCSSRDCKRKRIEFQDGGIEEVIGVLPSCVRSGPLYRDLVSNAKVVLGEDFDLKEDYDVKLFGEVYFLDSRIEDEDTLRKDGLANGESPVRAGFFIVPGWKYFDQFDEEEANLCAGDYLKRFFTREVGV